MIPKPEEKLLPTFLLIIDDEADHASVDTGEQIFGEDGNPDPEHQPTAINLLIRKVLHTFSRSAYVGYTATPFANIFIHERGETSEAGPDLFPSAFIINLAAPSTYIGPSKVFGLVNGENRNGLPLVRSVDDYYDENTQRGWMPIGHKNGHKPVHDSEHDIPNSLVEAINAFILACAARKSRNQGTQHSSMLVHVTRFTSVQKEVYHQVENYILHVRQRLLRSIGEEVILEQLRDLWIQDFLPTSVETAKFQPDFCRSGDYESWEQIKTVLCDVIAEIQVKIINGTAKDVLDYKDSPAGLKVIAIGGDKLARGLTLEGLYVRTHPKTFIVTACNKMRSGRSVTRQVSLEGRLIETSVLFKIPDVITNNLKALGQLIQKVSDTDSGTNVHQGYLYKNIPVSHIEDFLKSFINHPASQLTASKLMRLLRMKFCITNPHIMTIFLANPLKEANGC